MLNSKFRKGLEHDLFWGVPIVVTVPLSMSTRLVLELGVFEAPISLRSSCSLKPTQAKFTEVPAGGSLLSSVFKVGQCTVGI